MDLFQFGGLNRGPIQNHSYSKSESFTTVDGVGKGHITQTVDGKTIEDEDVHFKLPKTAGMFGSLMDRDWANLGFLQNNLNTLLMPRKIFKERAQPKVFIAYDDGEEESGDDFDQDYDNGSEDQDYDLDVEYDNGSMDQDFDQDYDLDVDYENNSEDQDYDIDYDNESVDEDQDVDMDFDQDQDFDNDNDVESDDEDTSYVQEIGNIDVDALANANMSPEEIMAFLKNQKNNDLMLI